MATPVKRGSDEPQRQYWESQWSPEQGGIFQTEYKGINVTKMSALANSLAMAGYKFTLRHQFGVATLSATISSSAIPGGGTPPGSDITDKWEVSVDQEKPDLTQNSTFLGIAQARDSATPWTGLNRKSKQIIAAMKESATNPILYDSTGKPDTSKKGVTPFDSFRSKLVYTFTKKSDGTDSAETLGSGINVLGTSPTLIDFAIDYFEGRTNFLRGKYVLRHTTSAPSNYNLNVADFNVEKIYTISQLLSECQSTSLWILPLPSYLAYKISSYPIPDYIPSNYQWGALKSGSSASSAANRRIEIQTEYLIDGWPIHTYGLKS